MKTCCIIGHRNFEKSGELEIEVKDIVTDLIEKQNVKNFLFGSRSEFTNFCYDIISKLMNKYSNLKRIFIRAEYPIISNDYYNYLLGFYEESYFYSEKLITNKFSYIKRDKVMIDKSVFCIFYFNDKYIPQTKTQSGTRMAYEYALRKGKKIINVFDKG